DPRYSWVLEDIHFGATVKEVVLFDQNDNNDAANRNPDACGSGEVITAAVQSVTTTQTTRETCDDGNAVAGDGCSATCQLEVCGYGILDTGEQCDDANVANNDGSSSTCKNEVCGDGVVQVEPPITALDFTWLATSCSGVETINFTLNGSTILSTQAD